MPFERRRHLAIITDCPFAWGEIKSLAHSSPLFFHKFPPQRRLVVRANAYKRTTHCHTVQGRPDVGVFGESGAKNQCVKAPTFLCVRREPIITDRPCSSTDVLRYHQIESSIVTPAPASPHMGWNRRRTRPKHGRHPSRGDDWPRPGKPLSAAPHCLERSTSRINTAQGSR